MNHVTMLLIPALLACGARGAVFSVTNVTGLQTALSIAQTNGADDVINVASGVYAVTARLTYAGAENRALSIIGAGAAVTRLDGGHARQIMQLDNAMGGNISVAGLAFVNASNSFGEGIGGGLAMVCNGAGVPCVASCVFSNNCARRTAGGVYLATQAGAVITNCIAARNTTVIDDGGGMYVYKDSGDGTVLAADNSIHDNYLRAHPDAVGGVDGSGLFIYYLGSSCTIMVSNNVLRNNTLQSGHGAFFVRATSGAHIHLINNVFSGNVSADDSEIRGGAAHLELETGLLRVSGNYFLTNRVAGTPGQGDGGGLAVTFNTSGAFELRNNIFARNEANRHGGGANIGLGNNVTQALIVQNLFIGNCAGAEGAGGALQLNAACAVTLINNTMTGNRAGDAGGLGYYAEAAADRAWLYNEIYWSNAPNALAVLGTGTVAARHSALEHGAGESWFGAGCSTGDPCFVSSVAGNYRLADDSPCINTGTNFPWMAGALDLDGNPRVYGSRVDMGCYEFVPEPAGVLVLAVPAIFSRNAADKPRR